LPSRQNCYGSQEKEFERIGGNTTIKADVRIITATNRNLEGPHARGKFREDSLLSPQYLPHCCAPLRERKTDIMLLADYFIDK